MIRGLLAEAGAQVKRPRAAIRGNAGEGGSMPPEPARPDRSDRLFQRLDQIGPFPGKAAIRFGRTAKVAIGSSLFIHWLNQVQHTGDAVWT